MQQFQQQAALQPPQPTQAITGPTQTLHQGQFTNQQPQKDYSSVMVARQSQMNPLGLIDQ
uniref:TATA-box binding protein n=1 Tax=Romanomermis culicivorax TaxID=13658 RepID=A0A915IH00_ROMCU